MKSVQLRTCYNSTYSFINIRTLASNGHFVRPSLVLNKLYTGFLRKKKPHTNLVVLYPLHLIKGKSKFEDRNLQNRNYSFSTILTLYYSETYLKPVMSKLWALTQTTLINSIRIYYIIVLIKRNRSFTWILLIIMNSKIYWKLFN